jgi:transcriptional regulator with XRE-family HTH domain
VLQAHNAAVADATTDGERIALRRRRLGWKQEKLSDAAGVSLTTLVQIEKDRNVRVDRLRAVEAALDKAEKKRGGPNLADPSGTTEPSLKEGAADVSASVLEDWLARIDHAEVFFAKGLASLRLLRMEVDSRLAHKRQSG